MEPTNDLLRELTLELERTTLTENELSKLMFASSRDRVVQCAYGTNGVYLLTTDSNQWAFDILAEMRHRSATKSQKGENNENCS